MTMERDEEIDAHESYAVAVLTRVTGGTRLFGTAIDTVPSFVELTITRAEMRYDRELLDDRITEASLPYPERHLVSLRLSEVQLAELLMSVGVHPGVPVTLTRIAGKRVADVPDTHRTAFDRIHEQASAPVEGSADEHTNARLRDAYRKLREVIEERVPKKDQQRTLWLLDALHDGGHERASYMASRVREATQKTVRRRARSTRRSPRSCCRRGGRLSGCPSRRRRSCPSPRCRRCVRATATRTVMRPISARGMLDGHEPSTATTRTAKIASGADPSEGARSMTTVDIRKLARDWLSTAFEGSAHAVMGGLLDELEKADANVRAVVDAIPSAARVHVHEGGGPEDVYASLAVSAANLAEQVRVNADLVEKNRELRAQLPRARCEGMLEGFRECWNIEWGDDGEATFNARVAQLEAQLAGEPIVFGTFPRTPDTAYTVPSTEHAFIAPQPANVRRYERTAPTKEQIEAIHAYDVLVMGRAYQVAAPGPVGKLKAAALVGCAVLEAHLTPDDCDRVREAFSWSGSRGARVGDAMRAIANVLREVGK